MAEEFVRTKYNSKKKTPSVLQELLAFVTGTERVLFCFPSSFFLKGEVCYKDVSVSHPDRQTFA